MANIKIYLYDAPLKNKAFPGTEEPASDLVPFFISSEIHEGSRLPLPTSISEPTTALTMFLRKRLALMVNTM